MVGEGCRGEGPSPLGEKRESVGCRKRGEEGGDGVGRGTQRERRMSYEEEDTCASYEEEDTCVGRGTQRERKKHQT